MLLRAGAWILCLSTIPSIVEAQTPRQSDPEDVALRLLDVPFVSQTEQLCGGAAAAMVMRYWGARGIDASRFASLVTDRERGIAGGQLEHTLRSWGWESRVFRGDATIVRNHLARGRPVIALIEDRPGRYHYVVVIGWLSSAVVLHDPARAPFRLIAPNVFERLWGAADRWTLLLLPGAPAMSAGPELSPESSRAASRAPTVCQALVDEGIAQARRGDRRHAEAFLVAAAQSCATSAAAHRELAGLRFIEKRYREAAHLAQEAVRIDPTDQDAWRLLGAGRYLADDAGAALDAWNRVKEPKLDLVRIEGLVQMPHRLVEDWLGVGAGEMLTRETVVQAERRLALLPGVSASRLTYQLVPGGLAELQAAVVERSRSPARLSLLADLVRIPIDRELEIGATNIAGAAERWRLGWRFWEARPRVFLSMDIPVTGRMRGVWRFDGGWERQDFESGTPGSPFTETRRHAGVRWTDWVAAGTRLAIGLGVDRWDSVGVRPSLAADVEVRSSANALETEVAGAWWPSMRLGAGFGTVGIHSRWLIDKRDSLHRLSMRAAVDHATSGAPLDLWPGAGTGHARQHLLRAHPLLNDGVIAGEVFGRTLGAVGVETERDLFSRAVATLSAAAFVDAARAWRSSTDSDSRWQVDVGGGLRLRVVGASGRIRIDFARGLRDGNHALSVGWERQ